MKTTRKVLAILMSLCLAAVPFTAFAEGGETVNTTTTTTVDENGNTVVTVAVEKKFSGEEEGAQTERTEVRTDVTVTDGDGVELSTAWTEKGSETKEWDNDDAFGTAPDVSVQLVPGSETTASGSHTEKEEIGQKPDGEGAYDYTEYETTTNREVSAETGDMDVTIIQDAADMEAIGPEAYEGKVGMISGLSPETLDGYAADVEKPAEDGYDYQFTGYGDATHGYRVLTSTVTYKRDADGNLVLDDEGNYIIENKTYPGKYGSGLESNIAQFALTEYTENGEEYVYAYCIDNDTDIVAGAWYRVSNLEDSDYYPDAESAAKLRAIANNGYWGTKEGKGSVSKVRESMRAAFDEDDTVTVLDKNGNEVTYRVIDLIDDINEAEALTATQAAIWTYSNGSLSVQDGNDGNIVEAPVSVIKPKPNLNKYERTYDTVKDARLMAIYQWLLGLEGETADEATVVINENNAVDNMQLTVRDKVSGHGNNEDNDDSNDVFNTELNFSLKFVPDLTSDDLLVYVTAEDGSVLTDANGDPIVRRLAGANSEGREHETITPDANGVYTITGLQLAENTDFVFDLRLEGTQYLKEGVYIYNAVNNSSQTLVGVAQGSHEVEVSVGMSISFNVDDSNHVVARREWYAEGDPILTPDGDDEDPVPGDEEPVPTPEPPVYDSVQPYSGGYEIPDEEVPLADVPTTGDSSWILIAAAALAAIGIAATFIFTKKKAAE